MLNQRLKKALVITSLFFCLLACNDVWAKSSVWKVSKGNQYIYVGGTIHLLAPSEFPLPKEFNQAYQDSNSLVLEAKLPESSDMAFQLQMMQQMAYSNGKSINDYLSKRTQQQLSEYVASLGLDLIMFQHFKPGFLVTTLALLEAQRAGLSGEGVDIFYSKKAAADNKKIEYFESAQFQMNMISNMGVGHEDKFIQSNLKQMKGFESMFKSLLSAWRSGNESKLVKLAITPMKDDPKTLKTMLIDRNRNWVNDINKMFTDNEREFVLVGVAHLVGQNSLLDLLVRQGYQIEYL